MWWRRWVSPVVGSVASCLAVRASCARRWPRRDGVTRDFWTAMACLQLLLLFLHRGERGERVRFLILCGFIGPFGLDIRRIGVDRYHRHGKDEFILDQAGWVQLAAGIEQEG